MAADDRQEGEIVAVREAAESPQLLADPNTVSGYPEAARLFAQASARFGAGDRVGAAELFREVIERVPGMVAAHNNLGVALRLTGQSDEAIAAFRRAVEIAPDYAMAYANLGLTLRDLGRPDEAIQAFRGAVAADPAFAEGQNRLGALYLQTERPDLAVAHLRRATELAPTLAEAYTHLGMALTQLNRTEEAAAAHARVVALRPDDPVARFNLATSRSDEIPIEEVEAACRALIAAHPQLSEAHNGLGVVLQRQNRFEEALASFRRAVWVKPDSAQANINEAMVLLLLGRYEEGWPKYEWRRRLSVVHGIERALPPWQGEDIAGKSILLHSEQGLGDTLQFLRYVPLVAERARHVVLEIPRALVRMAASLPIDNVTIVHRGRIARGTDVHAPLLGLPRIFSTRVDNIPGRVPYLMPRRPLVERWAHSLAGDSRLKVGLVWGGNKEHKGDRRRSIGLARLAPLLAIEGIVWHSLQVGERAAELAALPVGTVIDLSPRLKDFAETAGAIMNLDLVIAVDTSVAHLAGALGKPAWVMLPFSPDWRWLLEREDSPWYPTLRLYRQSAPGDWDTVVARVAGDLAALVTAFGGRS
jgi:tetratricopeptide (TPR) repeat protein